jgi:hypothetical protein
MARLTLRPEKAVRELSPAIVSIPVARGESKGEE